MKNKYHDIVKIKYSYFLTHVSTYIYVLSTLESGKLSSTYKYTTDLVRNFESCI